MNIYAILLNIAIEIIIIMQYNIFIFFKAKLKGVYHEKANQKNPFLLRKNKKGILLYLVFNSVSIA